MTDKQQAILNDIAAAAPALFAAVERLQGAPAYPRLVASAKAAASWILWLNGRADMAAAVRALGFTMPDATKPLADQMYEAQSVLNAASSEAHKSVSKAADETAALPFKQIRDIADGCMRGVEAIWLEELYVFGEAVQTAAHAQTDARTPSDSDMNYTDPQKVNAYMAGVGAMNRIEQKAHLPTPSELAKTMWPA